MKSTPLGYAFAIIAFTIFSVQDAVSKHLGMAYPPVLVAMFRYWAFAIFAILFAMRARGGLRAAVATKRPVLQIARGLLLAVQIPIAITAFAKVGLAQSQAIFASGPLIVALLSVPILGEKVGWRRWTAIGVGLCGVLLILSPSGDQFSPLVILPISTAVIGALYGLMTRLVSRVDGPMTSFFYIGTVGAVALSIAGPFFWTEISAADWKWMILLCCTGIAGHYLLIKAYDNLDAVAVQPITYLQLVLASGIAVLVFGEVLRANMVIGAAIVVGAGLFTVWRENVLARRNALKAAVDL
ncbi:EamA/RhaT family transporter [Rhizobium sp. KAs_5_22]|uniref:DMT family transporter n=1 Tax=Ciceribacter selenitireducens TaxID=448181 RepID=UPI0004903116|nr:DMT family transporter [Ciceribacter selenitireducens]PPJ45480.1 EamA/RhaT family transporter [Rhizobium sp. KAs_5_22]